MVVTLGHGLEAQKYQLKTRVVDMGQLGDKNQKGPLYAAYFPWAFEFQFMVLYDQ